MLRKLIRRHPSTFLIILSPRINTDVLDFVGLVRFWDVGGGLFISLSGCPFASLVTWLMSFIFEDVTSVLVKCVLSSGCAWITLSICVSFTLPFCLANFVICRSVFDSVGFEVVDIQVLQRSSYFSEMLPSFRLSHGLPILYSREFCLSSVLMTLFFPYFLT